MMGTGNETRIRRARVPKTRSMCSKALGHGNETISGLGIRLRHMEIAGEIDTRSYTDKTDST